MKFKKVFSVLLASMLLMTGCASEKKVSKEDPNAYPEEPYEINWYINSKPQKDVELIENAMNEILTKEINSTIKLHSLDSAQYSKMMSTKMSAGDYFDIAFTSGAVLSYSDSVKVGSFFDIAPYIDEYMPKTKELFDQDFLSLAYVEGKLGGIPVNKEFGSQIGWIYRKDIADKYSIDMTQYKTLDELEPVLEMIKQNEPSIDYPMEWDTTALNQNCLSYMMPALDCVIYTNGSEYKDVVEIFPESEEFKALAKTARRYYEKGLVKPDVLTATDASSRFMKGSSFCIISALKPGAAQEKYGTSEFPVEQAGFSEIIQGSPINSMLGISATSKNPYRVMRFLELLYTNKELQNLVVYGIEGKHYTKIDDNTIELIKDSGYDLSKEQWMMGNIFNLYLLKGEDPQKHEKFLEFNKEAKFNPVSAFAPDLSSVELEKVAINGVKAQYRNQALLGAVDPDTVIDEYVKKLKEAGIDKVINVLQEQYDEFLKGVK